MTELGGIISGEVTVDKMAVSCRNIWQSRHTMAYFIIGRDTRGMVVSIYLDPENDQGSTRETLVELEWTQGHLVQ